MIPALLLLLTLPAVVQAQFNYTTQNGTITIIGYTGPGGAVTIPSTINGLPVIRIGNYAFFLRSSLTSLTIPNSVTSIGWQAFSSCTGLTGVYFQGNAPNLGLDVFAGANNATVYYRSGNTGCGPTFGGRPTVLWKPQSPYTYQQSGSTNWLNATLVMLDGVPYSTNSRVAAAPSGTDQMLVWDALTNLGSGGTTNILLRARAQDITLMGDWSAGTPFQVNTVTGPDADGDDLPDWWESQSFGGTAANPDDDPDGDGFKNWQEYIADTNPTNTASHLSVSVGLLADGVKLDWLAGSNSWQYLQRVISLSESNAACLNLWTSPPPPSADSGSYTDSFGTNMMQFYRMQVTR